MTAGFGLFQWGGYLSYRVGRQNFSILYLFKQMAGIVPLSMLKSIHHITQHACMYTNDYNQWENIIIIIICHQIHYLQTIEHIITNLSGYAIMDYYCPLLLAMLTVLCHKCTNMLEPWQCHTVSVHLAHKRIVHRVGNTESRGRQLQRARVRNLPSNQITHCKCISYDQLFIHACKCIGYNQLLIHVFNISLTHTAIYTLQFSKFLRPQNAYQYAFATPAHTAGASDHTKINVCINIIMTKPWNSLNFSLYIQIKWIVCNIPPQNPPSPQTSYTLT